MELDKKTVQQMQTEFEGVRQVMPGVWEGPWLKGKYFDNYPECLFANTNHKRNLELKSRGLNEQGQTPEQVKDFEIRKKLQEERKHKAEVAAEMALQNK